MNLIKKKKINTIISIDEQNINSKRSIIILHSIDERVGWGKCDVMDCTSEWKYQNVGQGRRLQRQKVVQGE